jgi:hypothetical protein
MLGGGPHRQPHQPGAAGGQVVGDLHPVVVDVALQVGDELVAGGEQARAGRVAEAGKP